MVTHQANAALSETIPIIQINTTQPYILPVASTIQTCNSLVSIEHASPIMYEPCHFSVNNDYPAYHAISYKTQWVRFTLHNSNNHAIETWLTTGHPLLEKIRVWQNDQPVAQDIGSTSPQKHRLIPYEQPLLPIVIEPHSSTTLIIGYASSTYISTQITLWKPSAYLQYHSTKLFYQTLTLGGLLLALLISLLAYISLRDRLYLFFFFALMTEMLINMATSGKLLLYYPYEFTNIYTQFLYTISLLNILFYILFVHRFIQQLTDIPWLSQRHIKILSITLGLLFIIKGVEPIVMFIGIQDMIDPILEIGSWSILLTIPLMLISIILPNRALKQEIQQRTQENEAKSKFLREVNHEIRAPLNRVLSQALEIERPSLREKIIQNCRHVILTIDEALSYSNNMQPIAKADQTVLTWSAFIDILAQSGHEIVHKTHKEHHNDFKFNALVQPYPWIMIDERRVLQIIDNLITNAARYTQQGNITLTLSAHLSDTQNQLSPNDETLTIDHDYTMVVFTIQDTGLGISQEDQQRIFDPLVRGKAGINSGCKGAGMGLAIVKQLVEQLQGSISLESEEGKGTSMIVSLPIYPATPDMYQDYQNRHSSTLTPPNDAEMKHLNTLIQQGGISDIIRWANQLSAQKTELTKFTQEITQAAIKGDMARLRQLARHTEQTQR